MPLKWASDARTVIFDDIQGVSSTANSQSSVVCVRGDTDRSLQDLLYHPVGLQTANTHYVHLHGNNMRTHPIFLQNAECAAYLPLDAFLWAYDVRIRDLETRKRHAKGCEILENVSVASRDEIH